MRATIFVYSVLLALCMTGCYTQLALQPPPPATAPVINDGDSEKPALRIDTIVTRDRETCVWTRNFFGEPILRCYKTTYGRDWYVYRDYPWWYREAPFYYDQYGRCPRYYYYDADDGSCRYYYGRSSFNYFGSGSSSSTPSSSPSSSTSDGRRSRSYGIPQTAPGSAAVPKSQEAAPVKDSAIVPEEKSSRRSRSYGIPDNVPVEPVKQPEPLKKENPQPPVTPSSEPVPAVDSTPSVADTTTPIEQPRRRNGRGW